MVPLAVCALAVGHAVPSYAAVSVAPNGLVQGDSEADWIVVTCTDGLLHASGVTAGESCATATELLVTPGGGADHVLIGAVTASSFPLLRQPRVDVREGVPDPRPGDVVSGSSMGDLIQGDWRDQLLGGEGDDVIIGGLEPYGGPGDDVMQGAALKASGGDGDDRFVDTLVVDGGPGVDTWEAHFEVLFPSADLPYIMTPDGLFFAEITGGPGWGGGVERVTLVLLHSRAESYDGSRFGGPQTVHGLGGDDALIGGPGNDRLIAGPGDDSVDAGSGADVVDLGEGDDTARVRDRLVDQVSCGPGTDSVVADAIDKLVGCETVSVPIPRTSRIRGARTIAKPDVARFAFSSPTAGATFQCRLDKGAWKACTSRHKVRTAKIRTGRHTLRVRAVLAGRADPTPSVKRFTVTG